MEHCIMKNVGQRVLANGLGLMLLAALIFSFNDVLLKFLLSYFPVMQLAFIRFAMGGFILWPILSSQGIHLRGNDTWILVLRGLCGTLSFFCILKSMAMISLSNAIVLFYTFPIFVLLFSFLLFGTAIEKGEFVLILVGLVGIYILIDPDFHSFNKGYLWGLLGGCLCGIATVMVHKAREKNGPLIIYFYFCLMGAIFSFPFFQGFRLPDAGQGILLVASSLAMLIAQVLMNQGFKFCKAAEGSLILMSEVVLAGIAGVLIFKDPVTPNFLVGAVLIVGSGLGLNLLNRKSRHSPLP